MEAFVKSWTTWDPFCSKIGYLLKASFIVNSPGKSDQGTAWLQSNWIRQAGEQQVHKLWLHLIFALIFLKKNTCWITCSEDKWTLMNVVTFSPAQNDRKNAACLGNNVGITYVGALKYFYWVTSFFTQYLVSFFFFSTFGAHSFTGHRRSCCAWKSLGQSEKVGVKMFVV